MRKKNKDNGKCVLIADGDHFVEFWTASPWNHFVGFWTASPCNHFVGCWTASP